MNGTTNNATHHHSTATKRVLLVLHLLVLIASAGLVLIISWDTFHSMSFVADPVYLNVQYWICLFFLFDIVVEWAIAHFELKYLWRNFLFILVSIPYLNIISHLHLHLPEPLLYVLRFIPLLRAAYVLAMVMGVFSANRISSMFKAYIALLVSTLYFGSLMFFIEEHAVNPGVDTYWSALWWAIMDMTTTGSSINALTPTGKTLGVVLAAEGLILFPVFTVYITDALTRSGKS